VITQRPLNLSAIINESLIIRKVVMFTREFFFFFFLSPTTCSSRKKTEAGETLRITAPLVLQYERTAKYICANTSHLISPRHKEEEIRTLLLMGGKPDKSDRSPSTPHPTPTLTPQEEKTKNWVRKLPSATLKMICDFNNSCLSKKLRDQPKI